MLKRLNVLIYTLCLSTCILFNSAVLAEVENNMPKAKNEIEYPSESTTSEKQVKVKDLDINPINTESLKKSVVPDPKQEGKKVIGLFLKTMLAVAFCGVLIYIVLYFVKKFYGNMLASSEYNKEMENLDLSTPQTKEEAFRSFLNRTK